ncbi:ATP-binding protein [Acanthopleuribacter pedis]|uniref:histidine kinase n=1 Tax=Acanthopleuribacter pedis TaxID=442870 RepID=A0A8J7QDG9_9BACT|nr:ATP-binding protein [Acanthopleuribacter pedis]MBO1317585.1 response regulator [Acanthopleuribacter pedis]
MGCLVLILATPPLGAQSEADTAKIEALLEQGDQWVDQQPTKVLETVLPELREHLRRFPNPNHEQHALKLAFWANLNLEHEDKARVLLKERLKASSAMGADGSFWYAEALTDRAILSFYAGEYRAAIDDNRAALGLMESRAPPEEIAETLNNLGVFHRRLGEFEISLDYSLRALQRYQAAGMEKAQARTLNNIGMVYQTLKQHENALEFFHKSLALKEKLNMQASLAQTLNNIGFVYMNRDDLEQARVMFDRALDILIDYGDPRDLCQAHLNVARIYRLLGDLEKSKLYGDRATELARELGHPEFIGGTKLEAALQAYQAGQPKIALERIEEAVEIIRNSQNTEDVSIAYHNYAAIAADNGLWEKAYLAHQIHKDLQDKLFNAEATRAVTGLQAKFENDQREGEIARLKKENERKEKQVIAQKRLRNASMLILVLLFSFILALVARNMASRKYDREKQLNEHLLRLDRMKDAFLANTSHELRTPLNGIIGLAESLADGATGELNPATQRNLGMIIAGGRRLSTLIDDLLDYSKIAKQSLDIQTQPVQLHAVVEMVLDFTRPTLGKKTLEITNQVPVGLAKVQADENRLIQILHNLIHNAVKFTDTGFIRVSARAGDQFVTVAIEDSGIGIPEAHFESIFKAFEQVDSALSRRFSGTGLGLAITKELVTLHGGDIWVESQEEKGTTFRFTLPIATGNTTRETATPAVEPKRSHIWEPLAPLPAPEATPHAVDDSGMFRILVVDDEEVNRQVLVNHLSIHDYEIVQAGSGAEALQKLAGPEVFHLVLLDIMMPNMSGYQVCEVIRENHPPNELPVLFLTAKSRLQDLVRGFKAGANDYLTKPVTKEELRARVDVHAQLKRATLDLERKVSERTADLKMQNQELETLNEVVKTVNREVEMKALAQALLSQAINLLPDVKSGGLLLRDHQTDHFTFAALAGYEAQTVSPIRFDFQEATRRYTGQVGLADGVWLISNPANQPGREKFAGLPMPGSLLTVTLPVDDHLLEGVLVFDHESSRELIDDGVVARLVRFREHAITALTKACHVEKILKTTENLRQTQRRLIETAHLAGRAEIAASVLHNLGNALNSLVSSAVVLQENISTERIRATLQRIADHLSDTDDQQPEITREQLAKGVATIIQLIRENENAAREEADHLLQTIEGIRDIVSAQESYAQVAGYCEEVDLQELLQELIQAESGNLAGMNIPITADISARKKVPLQRFKLITVLHHLIGNAARAVEHQPGGAIHITDEWTGDGRFRIIVSDNGVGLAKEELSLIFRRGHSKQGDEHDLSLHLTANTIADMGGRLWAESEGRNHGARFIIELPEENAVPEARLNTA